MDKVAASRLKHLLQEMQSSGSVHFSEVEPLFRDPEASNELDTFLIQMESTNAKLLPDVRIKLPASPPTGMEDVEKDDNHPLQVYLREVARVPSLKSDREAMLLQAVAINDNGADTAKKELVEANLALVVSIAEEYGPIGSNTLDLIESGNHGLIKAVNSFRLGRGYRLSTYVAFCAHRALAEFLSREPHLQHMPAHLQRP